MLLRVCIYLIGGFVLHLPEYPPSIISKGSVDKSNVQILMFIMHITLHYTDQNEKCAITYVIARDGYSGKIVGAATMSIKNNLVICDKVYRAAVLEYGIWDQVPVDHGREFYLMLFIQEKLREQHGNPDVSPYLQTSQNNHVIERVWVE